MPGAKENAHHTAKVYVHRKSMDEEEEESVDVLPSASNILVDDGVQVSTESILEAEEHGRGFIADPRHKRHTPTTRTCLPDIIVKPPEEIRATILNKGESYWKTSVKYSVILATSSLVELLIYLFVYAGMGHFRIILALLPVRETVVIWFFIMFGADILVMIIIKLGKCVSSKFGSTKRVDMYFILFGTCCLIFSFLISIGYPVYATPHLLTKVKGTIVENNLLCMKARDDFTKAGYSWDAIDELREICEEHILCVEGCRDFRAMYFWFYGTYFLTILRLFVLITLWDICSFLCMVMDLREENITYTINLPGGYHM